MKSFKNFFYMLASALILLSSCEMYPDDEIKAVSDLDTTTTLYDEKANFNTYKTYAIVDTVRQISNDNSGTPLTNTGISNFNNNLIISTIRSNMNSLGYQLIDNPEEADLAVNVGAVITQNIIVDPGYYYGCGIYWCDPGYWYGYPGYGYYYPYYPSPVVAEYKTGTLIIDLVDLKNGIINPKKEMPVVWTGIVNGVVNSDEMNMRARAVEGIDQAFYQSPYLNNN